MFYFGFWVFGVYQDWKQLDDFNTFAKQKPKTTAVIFYKAFTTTCGVIVLDLSVFDEVKCCGIWPYLPPCWQVWKLWCTWTPPSTLSVYCQPSSGASTHTLSNVGVLIRVRSANRSNEKERYDSYDVAPGNHMLTTGNYFLKSGCPCWQPHKKKNFSCRFPRLTDSVAVTIICSDLKV